MWRIFDDISSNDLNQVTTGVNLLITDLALFDDDVISLFVGKFQILDDVEQKFWKKKTTIISIFSFIIKWRPISILFLLWWSRLAG